MSTVLLSPAFAPPSQAAALLQQQAFVALSPEGVASLAGCSVDALNALVPSWDGLLPDEYLKDGGRYRRRRHSCFVLQGDSIEQVPHRAHWQPVEYNALHGGMERWFAPMLAETVAQPAWSQLLLALGRICSELRGAHTVPAWYVEAHQFRIDTTDGIGRPTPEGAHRDGVDYVAVFLIGRHGIKGGETRVFEADGPNGQRFTMTAPWTLLLLDDARMVHESTPIQPVEQGEHGSYRDTLVVTFRAERFQSS